MAVNTIFGWATAMPFAKAPLKNKFAEKAGFQ